MCGSTFWHWKMMLYKCPIWYFHCWFGSMSADVSSSKDICGWMGLRRRYSSTWGMSSSSLWEYLMKLGSEVKGTTSYWLNEPDLARRARTWLTRRVSFLNTIRVRHCAQIPRLHDLEKLGTNNNDLKILWETNKRSLYRQRTQLILRIDCAILRKPKITINSTLNSRSFQSGNHCKQVTNLVFECEHESLSLMVDSFACPHLFGNM